MLFGVIISMILSITTWTNQNAILNKLTTSPEVFTMSKKVMPVVILSQLLKGVAYSTTGIILGGLDWTASSFGMQLSAILCVALVYLLPPSLWNIWIGLAVFMGTQVAHGI